MKSERIKLINLERKRKFNQLREKVQEIIDERDYYKQRWEQVPEQVQRSVEYFMEDSSDEGT